MKLVIWLIKKTEALSALSVRLVYWTGKAKVPIHPKHLIRKDTDIWYKNLLNKKMVILDAGCGSGQHSNLAAKYVKKIIGIDNQQSNIKIAQTDAKNKKINNVEFILGNLEKKISLQSGSVNLAILFDILEHIINRQKFLKEIKRLLKNKGIVLVVIPNNETSWKKFQRKYGIKSFSDPDHKIEYTKESITKELGKAGFQVRNITPISYDTPWVGFIDLIGGISLALYKRLSRWKLKMLKLHPENCSGYQIIASKI
ncbi:class I SAM-dependent methyltransferase [Candidatus Daviesbacteria bacterium]|nr:class I SAM-dependent methyltransferase [Candidatus Daviesbacteria bacterium]